MAIEKINFSYPKGTLQSVFDNEALTALELAAKTSKKVDECVEVVNAVEQTAIEATAIVDDMYVIQNQFVTDNSDTRAQLINDNQEYLDGLTASKEQFETALNASKEQFENNMNTSLSDFQTSINTSKTTFENTMSSEVNTIVENAETLIQTNVNEKIDTMVTDGTLNDIINVELFTDLETTINSTEIKLNNLNTLNVKDYGAVGDGITDDTEAFKSLALATEYIDNVYIYIPAGVYIVSERISFKFKNSYFDCKGKIKLIDGIQTPYGIVSFNGENNVIDGLYIDGNCENGIDEEEFGVSALLVIGSDCENLILKNSTFINAMYSAIVTNGDLSDILFENLRFQNIGEHCFYCSGGLNKNFTFKNLTVVDFGVYAERGQNPLNQTHHAYVIKPRNTGLGMNSNFIVENATVILTVTSANAESLLVTEGAIDKVTINNVKGDDISLLNITTANDDFIAEIRNVQCKNMFYGSPNKSMDIRVYDSYFKRVNYIFYCTEIKNTVFEYTLNSTINASLRPNKLNNILIENCRFVFTEPNGVIRMIDGIPMNILFKNCMFIKMGNSTQQVLLINNDGSWNDASISFENCKTDNITNMIRDNSQSTIKLNFINCTPQSRLYHTSTVTPNIKIINDAVLKTYGTTLERPITTNLSIGFIYFDTDLNRPVWWDGTTWIDPTYTPPIEPS